jgi:hypothetical protein
MHSSAQVSGVSLGNTGDQVAGACQSQRGRKAADDRDDVSFQPEGPQSFIDRPLSRPWRETQMCPPAA